MCCCLRFGCISDYKVATRRGEATSISRSVTPDANVQKKTHPGTRGTTDDDESARLKTGKDVRGIRLRRNDTFTKAVLAVPPYGSLFIHSRTVRPLPASMTVKTDALLRQSPYKSIRRHRAVSYAGGNSRHLGRRKTPSDTPSSGCADVGVAIAPIMLYCSTNALSRVKTDSHKIMWTRNKMPERCN